MKSLCCTDNIQSLRSSLEAKRKISISELHQLIECEVSNFKWHQSREVGYDIGEDKAFIKWKEKHGDNFFDHWASKL